MTYETLLAPPVLLAAAGIVMLFGEWLVRRAIDVLVLLLGAAAGHVLYEHLLVAGILTPTAWGAMAVMLLCGMLAVGLVRNDVVLRNLVILSTLFACLLVGRHMATVTGAPIEAVWIIFGIGAIASPPVLLGALVTALVASAAGPLEPRITLFVFGAAVGYSRLRHGCWSWRAVDPRLRVKLRRGGGGVSASGNKTVPVLLRCRWPRQTARIEKQLRQQNITAESLPGGYLATEVPAETLRKWSHPLLGLVQSQPDLLLSADTPVALPPLQKTGAQGITLDEIAGRLRADGNRSISPDKASGRGVVVAVIDTGVRPVNAALKRALISSEDFTGESSTDDLNGHGTMVAQHILAIAPEAKIVSLKVLDKNGSGSLLSVMRALKYVAEQGSKISVLNLSLGASLCHGDGSDPLCQALAHVKTCAIAAIGNTGPGAGTVQCPGCSKGAIGAGAIDADGHVAPFSSRGPCRDRGISKPDVVNFGVAIRVQDHTGSWVTVSGTSFASPLTAGVAACCISLNSKLGKDKHALYGILRQSGSRDGIAPRDRATCGRGLVNLCRAAGLAQSRAAIITMKAPLVWQPRVRFAAAATFLVVLGATWAVALDHSWSIRNRAHSDLRLLGRIGHSGVPGDPIYTVDDGTGVFVVKWANAASRPTPGSVAYVAVHGVVSQTDTYTHGEGSYRFTIIPTMEASEGLGSTQNAGNDRGITRGRNKR